MGVEFDEDEVLTLKISARELKLIQYWRESCHHYNDFCPFHCLGKKGTDFCHDVTEHLNKIISEARKKKAKEYGSPKKTQSAKQGSLPRLR